MGTYCGFLRLWYAYRVVTGCATLSSCSAEDDVKRRSVAFDERPPLNASNRLACSTCHGVQRGVSHCPCTCTMQMSTFLFFHSSFRRFALFIWRLWLKRPLQLLRCWIACDAQPLVPPRFLVAYTLQQSPALNCVALSRTRCSTVSRTGPMPWFVRLCFKIFLLFAPGSGGI